jgi:hypothetical protein
MALKELGILMVATNSYLERWKDTVLSLEESSLFDVSTRIHLFTNRPEEALSWSRKNLKRITVSAYRISGWGWPEATLLRYEFFHKNQSQISESVLMYLDSDMEVRSDFSKFLEPEKWKNGLAFVQHPGYSLPNGLIRFKYLILNPQKIISCSLSLLKNGNALGSWETRQTSKAYVPRKTRKKYVHGAIWFGKNEEFKRLCTELSHRTREDLAKGVIAIWHDESHLNWFLANHHATVLDNRFSGVDGYKNLSSLHSCIVTVEKGSNEGRQPTEEGIR